MVETLHHMWEVLGPVHSTSKKKREKRFFFVFLHEDVFLRDSNSTIQSSFKILLLDFIHIYGTLSSSTEQDQSTLSSEMFQSLNSRDRSFFLQCSLCMTMLHGDNQGLGSLLIYRLTSQLKRQNPTAQTSCPFAQTASLISCPSYQLQ